MQSLWDMKIIVLDLQKIFTYIYDEKTAHFMKNQDFQKKVVSEILEDQLNFRNFLKSNVERPKPSPQLIQIIKQKINISTSS